MTRWITALTFVVCSMAGAADLPVRYAVQETPLKTGTPAGTSITFSLYSDAACTKLVHEAAVLIEDVTLISRVKLLTPKGAVRPPATDEIQTTLPGVAAAGALYLTVTGTGVVPAGATCQPQVVSAGDTTRLSAVTLRWCQSASQYDLSHWCVSNVPSPLQIVSNELAVADRQAAATLQSLSVDSVYTCDIDVLVHDNVVARLYYGVATYGIANCVPVPPTCTDSVKNQDESDVDCGGAHCPGCVGDRTCAGASDCASGTCANGLCGWCSAANPSCGSTGSCPLCGDYAGCVTADDCTSADCRVQNQPRCNGFGAFPQCQPAHCSNHVMDAGEKGVDCGGTCQVGCDLGASCAGFWDCQSCACTGGGPGTCTCSATGLSCNPIRPFTCCSGVCNANSTCQ